MARAHGFHSVVARIVAAQEASIALHQACGFDLVGVEREIGRKFGRWLTSRSCNAFCERAASPASRRPPAQTSTKIRQTRDRQHPLRLGRLQRPPDPDHEGDGKTRTMAIGAQYQNGFASPNSVTNFPSPGSPKNDDSNSGRSRGP